MLPLIKFRLWISGRKSWKSDATSFPLNVIRWSMILNCPFAGYVHFFPWFVCVCGVQIPTSPRRLAYLTQRQAEQVRAQEYLGLYLVGQKSSFRFFSVTLYGETQTNFWANSISSLPSIINSAPLLCLPLVGNSSDGNESRFIEMDL